MPQTESTQKRTTRKYAALIAAFGAVSAGLLFLSRRYLTDYSEYYFPAYVVFAAAYGILLFRMRLKDLHREGRLHGMLLSIAEKGLASALVHHYIRRRRASRGPLLRLSLLAATIFLLVFVLAANDLLFEENLRLLENFDFFGEEVHDRATAIRTLLVQTEGRGTEERLQLMLKVTKDLTSAGAKVVVFTLPAAVSRPYYRDLIAQIQAAGPVVFAVRNDYFFRQPLTWRTREFYGPLIAPDTVVRNWGLMTGEFGDRPRTRRSIFFVPDGFSHNRPPGVDTIPDVVMEILRKWKDYPPEVKPVHYAREVGFGDTRIPVSRNGMAIAPYRYGPTLGFLKVMGADYWNEGGFRYRWDVNGKERIADDLMEFNDDLRGTIVMVSWYDPVENNPGMYNTGMYPATVIVLDALTHRFMSIRDDLHLPATALVLIAALLLILRARPLVSVPVLGTLCVALLFGGGWLFWGKHVITEVIYPVAGIVLCILLLPLSKISSEIEKEDP